MQRPDIQRIAQRLAARLPAVSAAVHEYVQISENLAKVMVSFTGETSDPALVAQAISAALDNRATPLFNSFRRIDLARMPCAVGFVCTNQAVREYPKDGAGYAVTAKNVLMDKSDETLWAVQELNGTSSLVRITDEPLQQILQASNIRSVGAPKHAVHATAQASVSEFVAFACPVTLTTRYGVVLSETAGVLSVFPTDGRDTCQVDDRLVIQAASLNGAEKRAAIAAGLDAAFDSRSVEAQKEFWTKVYGFAPEFVSELLKFVDESAVA